MLEIKIPVEEYWNSKKEIFEYSKPITLKLEHSLLSLAKWESKWHVPFLSSKDRTREQTLDYVRCMTVTPNVDPSVYYRLTIENMNTIEQYIEDPATATKFYTKRPSKHSSPSKRRVETSETIYASMIELGIPVDFEKRHLNHLMTLIRVCREQFSGGQKMSKAEQLAWQREQNEARKKKLHTKG